jgi:dihydropyrimidinase
VTVRAADLHDNTGYTPYEGRHIHGWPVTVLSRGRVIIDDGKLAAGRGSGQFLPCALSEAAKPLGRAAPEFAFAASRGGHPLV